MLLSWLSKFLASLLVGLLFITVIGMTLNQTLLSSHYLDDQLQHANAYPRLSNAISTQVAKDAGDTGLTSAQLAVIAHSVITPTVVQQKVSSTLSQLEAYYKGDGPVPTLDVSDLIAKAEALGLPAPKDSNLTHPITLTAASNAKDVNDHVKDVRLASLVAMLLLAGGLVAIAIKRRNYAPLANVAISLGALVGLVGAVLALATGTVDGHIKLDYNTNAFAGVAHDLATNIARNIGKRLLITGIVLLVVGIVARVLLHRYVKPNTSHVLPADQPTPPPVTPTASV